MRYYLAIDIGASSGRHILGWVENGTMKTQEIYRFENRIINREGHLSWDLDQLFREIKNGLKKCSEIGKIPQSMSIDTWGVDYVLLDENNQILGIPYCYRDKRTMGMDDAVYQCISEAKLYERTGIQKQIFNTIYQLMAVRIQHSEYLKQAKTLLMLPDYFHFLLTGNKMSEYTNATTGQLVNPDTKNWDYELIELLGFKKELFLPLCQPGSVVGSFTEAISKEVGFSCQVILPATHDTASAVMAIPSESDDCIYISSGTWSLMGIESNDINCSDESNQLNFTNEGGYGLRYRFLKNIMGLWMIQSVRHELEDSYSFAMLCQLGDREQNFASRVDVNDDRFLAPENMQEQIRAYCQETGQEVPQSVGQIAAVIYQSLAESYAATIADIEMITGNEYSRIHIIGGGANAQYLNQLTAQKSGLPVLAGPVEATAIGNLTAQMIADNVFQDLREARGCIRDSFEVKEV